MLLVSIVVFSTYAAVRAVYWGSSNLDEASLQNAPASRGLCDNGPGKHVTGEARTDFYEHCVDTEP
jgi:hypothetical protein